MTTDTTYRDTLEMLRKMACAEADATESPSLLRTNIGMAQGIVAAWHLHCFMDQGLTAHQAVKALRAMPLDDLDVQRPLVEGGARRDH